MDAMVGIAPSVSRFARRPGLQSRHVGRAGYLQKAGSEAVKALKPLRGPRPLSGGLGVRRPLSGGLVRASAADSAGVRSATPTSLTPFAEAVGGTHLRKSLQSPTERSLRFDH